MYTRICIYMYSYEYLRRLVSGRDTYLVGKKVGGVNNLGRGEGNSGTGTQAKKEKKNKSFT